MKYLPIIIIAGLGFWILTKLRATQSLSFTPRGVNFDGINLVITVGVQNTSMFPVSFQSFSGNILINGQPAGAVSDFVPQVISPLGETDISFSFIPQLGTIIQAIKNIFSSGASQTLGLQGTLQAENLSFPVNLNFYTTPAL